MYSSKDNLEKFVIVMGFHDSQCSVNVNFAWHFLSWQVCLKIHSLTLVSVKKFPYFSLHSRIRYSKRVS